MEQKSTLAQQLKDAQIAATQSHMLWRHVNSHIVRIIAKGIKNHKSRRHIASQLYKIAGPYKINEPVCLINYRSSAHSIKNGESLLYL